MVYLAVMYVIVVGVSRYRSSDHIDCLFDVGTILTKVSSKNGIWYTMVVKANRHGV